MATEVIFPKIGFSMTEGDLAEWMFADGEDVQEGETLFLLEADKASNEIEAPASGRLRIAVAEGETVAVGTVVGYIE